MPAISPWTSDLTARLIALRNEGLSFGKIAARLSEETGIAVSRNATLGKGRRLYLANRLARLDKKVAAKAVKPVPVQSHPRSAPPNFSVELGEFRVTVEFKHIGEGRT